MVEIRETKRNVCILSGETHCFCERKQARCGNIHDTLIGPHAPVRNPTFALSPSCRAPVGIQFMR